MTRVILIVALIGLSALYYFEMSKNVRSSLQISKLESEVLELKGKIEQLSAQRINMQNFVEEELGNRITTTAPTKLERSAQEEKQEKPVPKTVFSKEISKWAIDRRISDFEANFPLNDDEKERIRRKFELEQEAFERMAEEGGKFPNPRELEEEGKVETLEQIIGEERANQYKNAQKEKVAKYEEERIEDELFKMSRKLNLNPEQETATKEALRQINAEMKEYSLQMNSEEGEAASQNPFEHMKQMKEKKQQLLNERLRGVLNDEQLNRFAEEQANKNDWFPSL